MRKSFDDYFALFNKVYHDYDFEDYKKWAEGTNPTALKLIDIYGNPYECEKIKEGNKESETYQFNKLMNITIQIAAGPKLGSKPLKKKFPDSTSI